MTSEQEDNLALDSYRTLFKEEEAPYDFSVVYTGRVKDYGAYGLKSGSNISFKLSKKWRGISSEIQMGLIQELMLKLLKRKTHSMHIDLYNNFVRNLHIAIPKDDIDPFLEKSFDRVNERYFLGLVEKPNLVWGKFSTRTFGSYDFKRDRITMSTALKETDLKYLDYVMFHEMLHKQRKFFKSGTKTYYHDAKFKRLEKVFENSEQIEKELGRAVARERAKAYFKPKRRFSIMDIFQ